MMISPGSYYEEYLKNKPLDEILKCIRNLKKEICHCKDILEKNDETNAELRICPSPQTIISCNLMYLDMAKKALEDAGSNYVMSASEIKAEDFNEKLNYLKSFTFEIGGFCGEYTVHSITLEPEIRYSRFNRYMPEDASAREEYGYHKDEFIAMIKELRLGEWKHKYVDPCVLDGTQWELTIEYNNGYKTQKFYGSNAYPWNFNKLEKIFE